MSEMLAVMAHLYPTKELFERVYTSEITWDVVRKRDSRVVAQVLYCEHDPKHWVPYNNGVGAHCGDCGATGSAASHIEPRDVVRWL